MKHALTIFTAALLLAVGSVAALAQIDVRVERDRYRDRDRTADLIRAGDLVRADVVTQQGEDIGNVVDIVLNGDLTRASFLVVSFNREFGGGREYKLVPWRVGRVDCGGNDEGYRARGYREEEHEGQNYQGREYGGRDYGEGYAHGCAFVIDAPIARFRNAYGFQPSEWPNFDNQNWFRRAYRPWSITPDRQDVLGYRRGATSNWRVSQWVGMDARSPDGRELGRVDDLILAPDDGDVAFVLIDVGGDFRYRQIRTVAVPPDMIRPARNAILVNVDPEQLEQMAIKNGHDMGELREHFEARLRYGHERNYDRDRDRR